MSSGANALGVGQTSAHAELSLIEALRCAYDVRGLSGRSLLLGGVECHPLTLRRGALRRNEHHVPAAQFLVTLALDAA